MKILRCLLLVTFILMSAACAEVETSPGAELPSLRFEPKLSMFEEGKVHFELGIANLSEGDQAAIDDVNIRVVVTNQAGRIRNEMTTYHLAPIPSGETTPLLQYDGVYDPGRYVASMTSAFIPTLNLTFEIREENGVRILVAPAEFIEPHTEFTQSSPDL